MKAYAIPHRQSDESLKAITEALQTLRDAYRTHADHAMDQRDAYLVHRAISESMACETKMRRIANVGRI